MGYLGYTVGGLYDWAVEHYGERVAAIKDDRKLTYNQIGEMANQLGNALLGMGLKKGDRVGTLTANSLESIVLDYGLAKAGLCQVILHEGIVVPADNAYMANDSKTAAIIYHARFAAHVDEMRPLLKTVKHYLCIPDEGVHGTGDGDFHEIIAAQPVSDPPVNVTEADIISIYYTGGTTGVSKGCLHASRNRVHTYLTVLTEVGLGASNRFLHVAPMSHASNVFILPVCLRGGTQIVMDAFSPKLFLETVQREQASATFIVPVMLYRILDSAELGKHDVSSLDNIIYGASPIAPERLKEAIAAFGPNFVQVFGQTEAPMFLTILGKDDHLISPGQEARLKSCGKPSLMCRLRLVDNDDNDVPLGEEGEIVVRTPNTMLGYLSKPEETAETLKNGWLHTGDIGCRDEDGYVFILDRKKDMVISGGWNIYPKEIESTIHEHEAVADVAVIGIPDPKWGESVKACVVLHQGKTATAEEIIRFCKEKKGSVKTPKSVEFTDSIPLTSVGKHDKKALRARYWGDEQRRVH